MTKLSKPIHRVTNKTIGKRAVVLTIAPGTGTRDDLIGLRLQGTRTQYVCRLSDLYRVAALWHGQKEANARREARKNGIPWKRARKLFLATTQIPKPINLCPMPLESKTGPESSCSPASARPEPE